MLRLQLKKKTIQILRNNLGLKHEVDFFQGSTCLTRILVLRKFVIQNN